MTTAAAARATSGRQQSGTPCPPTPLRLLGVCLLMDVVGRGEPEVRKRVREQLVGTAQAMHHRGRFREPDQAGFGVGGGSIRGCLGVDGSG